MEVPQFNSNYKVIPRKSLRANSELCAAAEAINFIHSKQGVGVKLKIRLLPQSNQLLANKAEPQSENLDEAAAVKASPSEDALVDHVEPINQVLRQPEVEPAEPQRDNELDAFSLCVKLQPTGAINRFKTRRPHRTSEAALRALLVRKRLKKRRYVSSSNDDDFGSNEFTVLYKIQALRARAQLADRRLQLVAPSTSHAIDESLARLAQECTAANLEDEATFDLGVESTAQEDNSITAHTTSSKDVIEDAEIDIAKKTDIEVIVEEAQSEIAINWKIESESIVEGIHDHAANKKTESENAVEETEATSSLPSLLRRDDDESLPSSFATAASSTSFDATNFSSPVSNSAPPVPRCSFSLLPVEKEGGGRLEFVPPPTAVMSPSKSPPTKRSRLCAGVERSRSLIVMSSKRKEPPQTLPVLRALPEAMSDARVRSVDHYRRDSAVPDLVRFSWPERSWSFFCSNLRADQRLELKQFCEMRNIPLRERFRSSVTHLICNEVEGLPGLAYRTLKYLQAVASGNRWIVSYEWIKECIKKPNAQIYPSMVPYEMRGDSSTGSQNTPSIARRRGTSRCSIFDGLALCLPDEHYGEDDATISKDELTDLLRMADATIVEASYGLAAIGLQPTSERVERLALLNPNLHDRDNMRDRYRISRIRPISHEWVLDSISRQRAQPLDRFTLIDVASVEPLPSASAAHRSRSGKRRGETEDAGVGVKMKAKSNNQS